jgi:hypothetical protein
MGGRGSSLEWCSCSGARWRWWLLSIENIPNTTECIFSSTGRWNYGVYCTAQQL